MYCRLEGACSFWTRGLPARARARAGLRFRALPTSRMSGLHENLNEEPHEGTGEVVGISSALLRCLDHTPSLRLLKKIRACRGERCPSKVSCPLQHLH